MNILDFSDQAARQAAFPFFQSKICLNHAAVSPLPARACEALQSYAHRLAFEGQSELEHRPLYDKCKERAAKLIGPNARAEEIAFAGSTSHALGLVATGLDWQPGDNCVVADGDFPANVVTWKNLEATHDIKVRLIPPRAFGDVTLEDLAPYVDDRTRIVSLCSANYLSGCPLDVNAIGAWLHARGVLFCVDAIQTLGAIRLDTTHVDFVCADAHKWLLGPNGVAILWTRQSVLPQMRPAILGWLGVQDREHWFSYDLTPHPTSERFEPGAHNMMGIVTLEASLALLEEAGSEAIEARVTQLRDYAAKRLLESGCQLLWTSDASRPSGIVSFQAPHGKTRELHEKLDSSVVVSLRQNREGEDCIRVSPHFMNTEADIERLVELIG